MIGVFDLHPFVVREVAHRWDLGVERHAVRGQFVDQAADEL